MEELTDIQRLYLKFPASSCPEGCTRCCENSIQMAPEEKERIGGYDYKGCCPHIKDGRCGVYNDRPFICRLHGASVMSPCVDCECAAPLDEAATKEILHEYLRLKKEQETNGLCDTKNCTRR